MIGQKLVISSIAKHTYIYIWRKGDMQFLCSTKKSIITNRLWLWILSWLSNLFQRKGRGSYTNYLEIPLRKNGRINGLEILYDATLNGTVLNLLGVFFNTASIHNGHELCFENLKICTYIYMYRDATHLTMRGILLEEEKM